MDEKLKKELKQEIAGMDAVVGRLKFHNQLNSSWKRLRRVLIDRLKLEQDKHQGKLF
ncbi:MAG: hypothetical protein KOO65_05310 [Desulfobacterales bacterium]|nr:hypothetical protein [Desulfobacterales bacterium]